MTYLHDLRGLNHLIGQDVVLTACIHIGSDDFDVMMMRLVQKLRQVEFAIHWFGRFQIEVILWNHGQAIDGTLGQDWTKTQTIHHVS